MLSDVPNCVFDASGPLRDYSAQRRIASFFIKTAELSAVGAAAGSAMSLLSSGLTAARQKLDPSYQPSQPSPELGRASAGTAAFFALNVHARYQLLGGVDRYLFSHSNFLWTYLAATGLARLAGNRVGEAARPWFQGLAPAPAAQLRKVRRVVKKTRAVKRAASRPAAALDDAAAVAGPLLLRESAPEQQLAQPMEQAGWEDVAAGPLSEGGEESVSYNPLNNSSSYESLPSPSASGFSDLVLVTSGSNVDPQAALARGGTFQSVPDSESLEQQLQQLQQQQQQGRRKGRGGRAGQQLVSV